MLLGPGCSRWARGQMPPKSSKQTSKAGGCSNAGDPGVMTPPAPRVYRQRDRFPGVSRSGCAVIGCCSNNVGVIYTLPDLKSGYGIEQPRQLKPPTKRQSHAQPTKPEFRKPGALERKSAIKPRPLTLLKPLKPQNLRRRRLPKRPKYACAYIYI